MFAFRMSDVGTLFLSLKSLTHLGLSPLEREVSDIKALLLSRIYEMDMPALPELV